MSHSSSTAHYNLPQYAGTDIINPLTDTNDAYEKIDTALYNQGQSAAAVESDITALKTKVGTASLDTAAQDLSGAVNELKSGADATNVDLVTAQTDIGTLQSQMGTANTNIANLSTSVTGLQTEMDTKASVGALNSLVNKVGTGTLNTTAQNCVDAINEVLAEIPSGGSVAADDVTYDNTTSGLTASDVQSAIDEIVAELPSGGGTEEKQSATLTAGETSKTLTFTEQTISDTTLVLYFTSEYGVVPTDITTTSTTVVMTFEALDHNIIVGALVKN